MKVFILSVSTMVGTIIGAGIFGIPYVISKSGVVPGIFYFVILGIVVTLLHLFYGEICLRTQGKHRIVGYAQKYLGTWGRILTSFSLLFVLGGTLLAYLILAGEFLHNVFSSFIPLSSAQFSIVFLALCVTLIIQGRQLITRAEFVLNIGLVAVVAFIAMVAFPHVRAENFILLEKSYALLPFGVILFTLIGWEAIPEISSFLRDSKSKVSLKRVIITSTFLGTFLPFIFAFFVVGVSGQHTSVESFHGLVPILGGRIAIAGAVFGIMAISSSFLVLGNYLKNSLRHDFNISTPVALLITFALPLIPFLLGVRKFIEVIGILGLIIATLEGIVMILIFQKAKIKGDRTPEYSLNLSPLVLFFLLLVLMGGSIAALVL